jgi:tetratricopeptide (TPR) repeat protein
MSTPSGSLRELMSALPEDVAEAVQLCAIPHVLDDGLAVELVSRFSRANGRSREVVAHLKLLPIVVDYDTGWRLTREARSLLADALVDVPLAEVNAFLAEQFEERERGAENEFSPRARELRWQALFHRAPVAPADAIDGLHDFADDAVEERRSSDSRAVLQLLDEQRRWLGAYEVEAAYFRARHHYEFGNWRAARSDFETVVAHAEPSYMAAVATHLLGVIYLRSGEVERAIPVLRDALELQSEWVGEGGAMLAMNSLAGALLRKKPRGVSDLIEGEKLARESARIGAALEHRHHEAVVLNTLAQILLERGGLERVGEALVYARRSVEIGRRYAPKQHLPAALLTRSRAEERNGNVDAAIATMQEVLAVNAALGIPSKTTQLHIDRLRRSRKQPPAAG